MTSRIDQLPLGTPSAGHWLEYQDTDDTTDLPQGTSKRLNAADIIGGGGAAKFALNLPPILWDQEPASGAYVDTGLNTPAMQFPDTGAQTVVTRGHTVSGLGAGALSVDLGISHPATTGNLEFNVYLWAVNDGDAVQTENFDLANASGSFAVPATGGNKATVNVPLTNKSTITNGSTLAIKVERNNSVSGNAAGTASISAASIGEA